MSAPIHKAVMDDAIITVDGEPIAFHAQRNLPTVWFLATGARHRVIARYTGAPAPNRGSGVSGPAARRRGRPAPSLRGGDGVNRKASEGSRRGRGSPLHRMRWCS